MTTDQVQEGIIEAFSTLSQDMEMAVFYLMELGQKLPPMDESAKTDINLIKGCQSKVWMTAHLENNLVYFHADSNTAITKGLVSLLVNIFNGQTPDNILNTDLYFMHKIGMDRFIGTQRTNGFAAMIKQMKLFALALKTKSQVKP